MRELLQYYLQQLHLSVPTQKASSFEKLCPLQLRLFQQEPSLDHKKFQGPPCKMNGIRIEGRDI